MIIINYVTHRCYSWLYNSDCLFDFCKLQSPTVIQFLKYVLSEENIADIGTKALFGQDFRFKRQGLIGVQEGEAIEESVKRVKKIVTFDEATD